MTPSAQSLSRVCRQPTRSFRFSCSQLARRHFHRVNPKFYTFLRWFFCCDRPNDLLSALVDTLCSFIIDFRCYFHRIYFRIFIFCCFLAVYLLDDLVWDYFSEELVKQLYFWVSISVILLNWLELRHLKLSHTLMFQAKFLNQQLLMESDLHNSSASCFCHYNLSLLDISFFLYQFRSIHTISHSLCTNHAHPYTDLYHHIPYHNLFWGSFKYKGVTQDTLYHHFRSF